MPVYHAKEDEGLMFDDLFRSLGTWMKCSMLMFIYFTFGGGGDEEGRSSYG